jgi:hypothetical protein
MMVMMPPIHVKHSWRDRAGVPQAGQRDWGGLVIKVPEEHMEGWRDCGVPMHASKPVSPFVHNFKGCNSCSGNKKCACWASKCSAKHGMQCSPAQRELI